MNTYQPGNVVTVLVLFTTNATPPVPLDPTTILLRVTDPAGVETNYTYALAEVTRNSVGNFSVSFEVRLNGFWKYRWEGEGTVNASSESRFLVSQSAFSSPQ